MNNNVNNKEDLDYIIEYIRNSLKYAQSQIKYYKSIDDKYNLAEMRRTGKEEYEKYLYFKKLRELIID